MGRSGAGSTLRRPPRVRWASWRRRFERAVTLSHRYRLPRGGFGISGSGGRAWRVHPAKVNIWRNDLRDYFGTFAPNPAYPRRWVPISWSPRKRSMLRHPYLIRGYLVGARGFEPPTPSLPE